MKPPLSPQEREEILACLMAGRPLPLAFMERLFPLREHGAFFWPGKFSAKAHCAATPYLPPAALAAVIHTLQQHPWQGLLFSCDNIVALDMLASPSMQQLLTQQGGLKFIYIDPPFATDNTFMVSDSQTTRASGYGKKPILAYSDRWQGGKGGYFSMLKPRLERMYTLLAPDGLLCLHCDWRTGPGLRMLLDECFGHEAFVNEIIWHYTGGGRSKRYFSRKHDSLFVYAKGSKWTFNVDAIRVPYKKTSGYARSGIVSRAGKHYLPHPKGTPKDDVFTIPILNPMSKERLAYATQKPLALLEPLLSAFTNRGDLVGDFFCGSGTTLAAAASLGRPCIGCDQGEQAIKVSQERLATFFHPLGIPLPLPEPLGTTPAPSLTLYHHP